MLNTLAAQDVIISKMQDIVKNDDQRFYKIENSEQAQYLGELEIGGFTADDRLMYLNIYEKAKKLGANAFTLKKIIDIDGREKAFDPNHYFLQLYFQKDLDSVVAKNEVYLLNTGEKTKKLKIDDEKIKIPARHFLKLQLIPGKVFTVGTAGLLGSSIRLSASPHQLVNYFQIEGFRVKNNQDTFGINLKSGDINLLDRSYGMFLTTIYQALKEE